MSPNGNRRSLCVCMPGYSFSANWLSSWCDLFLHLVTNFHLRMSWSMGNNIYRVRETCIVSAWQEKQGGPPDLILWLDSDNPPSNEGFHNLLEALDASPEVSMVGGWYRVASPFTDPPDTKVAAGWQRKGKCENVPEERIRETEHLIEVDFIGFGMLLMRRQVIEDIAAPRHEGDNLVLQRCFEPWIWDEDQEEVCGFQPRHWLADDDSFCLRSRNAGHRVFLHPKVFLEHEKTLNVPAAQTTAPTLTLATKGA